MFSFFHTEHCNRVGRSCQFEPCLEIARCKKTAFFPNYLNLINPDVRCLAHLVNKFTPILPC